MTSLQVNTVPLPRSTTDNLELIRRFTDENGDVELNFRP